MYLMYEPVEHHPALFALVIDVWQNEVTRMPTTCCLLRAAAVVQNTLLKLFTGLARAALDRARYNYVNFYVNF